MPLKIGKFFIAVFLLLVIFTPSPSFAQQSDTSTGNSDSTNENGFPAPDQPGPGDTTAVNPSTNTHSPSQVVNNPALSKEVYGFIPYWEVSQSLDSYLQYKMLTTISYFGLSFTEDGDIRHTGSPYKTWQSDRLKQVFRNARAAGVKIHPSVVLFNGKGKDHIGHFLSNRATIDKGVKNIMTELTSYDVPVDGVNIDFESPSRSESDNFVYFIKTLHDAMKNYNSDWTLVIDTYASFGNWDVQRLAPYTDGFFVMSYHFGNPKTTKNAKSRNPYGILARVADDFLAKIPGNKVILGFPLYTGAWRTQDGSEASPAHGGGGLVLNKLAQAQAAIYGKGYDSKDKSAWYSYYQCTGDKKGWFEVYFDDQRAQEDKFGIANSKNLGGIGLWALGQDEGYLDTWNAIYNDFADKSQVSAPSEKPGAPGGPNVIKQDCGNPGPTQGPTPTKTPNPTAQPTPTEIPQEASNTHLLVTVGLDAIGNAGDSVNQSSAGSNKNPTDTSRNVSLIIKNSTNHIVIQPSGTLHYSNGYFQGKISIPDSLKSGNYTVRIKSPGYLGNLFPGITNIQSKHDTTLPQMNLVTGDVNSDNKISLQDYNLVRNCSIYGKDKSACYEKPDFLKLSDLNDDGVVDDIDLTFMQREFSSHIGD